MSLSPFLNAHVGQTFWLFGKGPSLSTFDFNQAGPLRGAINDVARYVPDCRYCFSNDGVSRWVDVYREGQVLFQPERAIKQWDCRKHGDLPCEVVVYPDTYNDERMLRSREELALCLTIRRGTLGSALQILHIMGIRTVHLVGIDGGQAHAPGFEWRTKLRLEHWKDYNAIRSDAIDQAELLGMELRFHNHDHTMENDGKKWVKFRKNCAVRGVHCPIGSLKKLPPVVADELVSMGAAVLHDGPTTKAAPPIETAADPKPAAAENATVATEKKPAKKAPRKQAKK